MLLNATQGISLPGMPDSVLLFYFFLFVFMLLKMRILILLISDSTPEFLWNTVELRLYRYHY